MNEQTNPQESEQVEQAVQSESAEDVMSEAADGSADPVDWEQKVAELEDRLIRSHAELANYRRRSSNEIDQIRKYEGLSLVRDLLPALDNLKRATAAAENASSVADLKTGVEMVLQQMLETLTRHHIEAIPAEGEPFDPNQHEAVQQIPSDKIEAMHVLQDLETGYRMYDRIVRPAKVIVSTGPAQ
ncbi:MAG: nucleotide exchange factor GrpE [Planctomycetaceae bacterium]|nr:nucleotide exchange factor GrpE [Planctomycetaceae bacterium]